MREKERESKKEGVKRERNVDWQIARERDFDRQTQNIDN